jgi:hypothetical protein
VEKKKKKKTLSPSDRPLIKTNGILTENGSTELENGP